jgi:hypothetical protein
VADDEQIVASAGDEPAGVGDGDSPDDRLPGELPVLWNSMDLPGMDSRD